MILDNMVPKAVPTPSNARQPASSEPLASWRRRCPRDPAGFFSVPSSFAYAHPHVSSTKTYPADTDSEVAVVLPEYTALVEQLSALPPMSQERHDLVEAAIGVWRRPGFDTFASVSNLPFDPLDYQLRAASVVLQRMSGRAILADEVGLGKTIEAGIVLSELRLRGLVRRVLVLTPTGLVAQWGEEFERKFTIPTTVATREGWVPTGVTLASTEDPVVLASLATARRRPLCDLLAEVEWDLVVVD
jgi:SNF2 family DNA or RNA helicase